MPNPDPTMEPFAIPEYFADDANNLRIVNGVSRLTFYSQSAGVDQMSVPVCHLAMPVQSLATFVARAIQVMTTVTVPIVGGTLNAAPKNDGHSN